MQHEPPGGEWPAEACEPSLLRRAALRLFPRRGGGPRGSVGPRAFALALQGGGAHGAFTWGVLDRLLETPGFAIEAISGTSAGALNAAVLAAGYLEDGPDGARRKLKELWRRVSRLARPSPVQPTPLEQITLGWSPDWSSSQAIVDLLTKWISPYQLNPLGLNPLRDILHDLIAFDRLNEAGAIRLFVAATALRNGAARIFTNGELSAEVLLASACLPALHQAVKLDDGYYWDGGFTANPAILPLIERCQASELLIVRIDSDHDEEPPVSARQIQARLQRVMLNAALKAELAALDLLRRTAAEAAAAGDSRGTPLGRRLMNLKIHMLADDDLMPRLDGASKLNPDWRFVRQLHKIGRQAAESWLESELPAEAVMPPSSADVPPRQSAAHAT